MKVLNTNTRLGMKERRRRFDLINERTLIVSTSLLARAIDIESLRVVVNFDLPSDRRTDAVDVNTYMYRIGRSSRFGKYTIFTTAVS